jgi:uncharacterized protein YdeI (YjbR/CyaY-like superfamily)
MKPRFFRTAAQLLVGFYKKSSGKPSITWPESVDEALCYGWIDGIRKRVDEESYTIRFTPRRAATWWVLSARLEATRLKRAQTLVQLSAKARLIPAFIRRRP